MDKINAARFSSPGFTPRKWTKSALECYELGCRCTHCPINEIIHNCKMKYTVFRLVLQFGAPFRRKREILEDK